jgi:hypothetical protein
MPMSDAQEAAVKECRKILEEHFEAFLLSFRTTAEDGTDKTGHDWHGKMTEIEGLSQLAVRRVQFEHDERCNRSKED